jgi:competence protein ComEA
VPDESPARPVPRPVVAESRWASLVDRLQQTAADPRFAVAALVVVALVSGLIWYRISLGDGPGGGGSAGTRAAGAASAPPRGAAHSPSSTPTTAVATGELVVHVSGAVTREGLVRVAPGSRVADAVAAAGGPAPGADLRRLNLAAKVLDGQQVAVPKVGEPAPVTAGSAGTGAGVGGAGPSADTPLDLNSATAAQLEALPGIGPSLASAILAERDRAGGFRRVDDLRRVRGIGDARFAQIRPLVRV